ncbi:DUF2627 domain-containing protein [Pueribacillus theae]|uniref:DUF2627 domain-containing protein n=1 Tax=Pueribacillus theae TaxID=2171751 RepID=A0A2U1K6P5_9BACI|nr:DUF2627 domain-containing protein [Pueribacillus theae]PWA13200.1 DUF2627 domain-containing protein [Pueribacillus theae]
MQRLLALLIVVSPVLLGVYGIKQMRDTLFGILNSPYPVLWLQFLIGFLAFIVGLFFIGSFIFYRDRKRNKLQPRFSKNDNK